MHAIDSEDHSTPETELAHLTPVVSGTPVIPVGGPIALSPSNPSTTSTSSSVQVTVPNQIGTATFQLVVTDNLGVQSQPAFATVTIQGPPTAVLSATPATVNEGGTITLSGANSSTGGSIAKYVFTLVPATS